MGDSSAKALSLRERAFLVSVHVEDAAKGFAVVRQVFEIGDARMIGDNLLQCTENSLLMDAKNIFEGLLSEDEMDFSVSIVGWLNRFDWLMRQEERKEQS